MKQTSVVNVKRENCDIYIGRPGIYGNPFIVGKDGDRYQVINKHRQAIMVSIDKGDLTREDFEPLQGKKLGCYCKPLACHGDVLADIANNLDEYFK